MCEKNVPPPRCSKAEREHKIKIKHHEADGDDDRDGDKAGKPNNHGQNVSAFTNITMLTGADKGAAVSAVACGGRRVDHSFRSTRGGEHGARGGLCSWKPVNCFIDK